MKFQKANNNGNIKNLNKIIQDTKLKKLLNQLECLIEIQLQEKDLLAKSRKNMDGAFIKILIQNTENLRHLAITRDKKIEIKVPILI